MNKQLIIIDGVGNYDRLFTFFARVWRLFGYDVRVFNFGWSDDAQQFDQKMQRLLDMVDARRGQPLYLIGASAGGTAAVHVLAARPQTVVKVVTLCSPLRPMPNLQNPLLRASIARLPRSFAVFDEATRAKLLSLYATRDNIVEPSLSQVPGVRSRRLFTSGHGFTIITTMTVFSFPIRRFFRSK